MSLKLTKKEAAPASAGKKSSLDLSGLPQVNLLPSTFREKRELAALKKRLGFGFIVLAAVLVLAYAGVHLEQSLVNSRYDRALAETVRLNVEEAKYAEVPLVLGQITKAETALRDGMYREILWKNYVGAVAATVPDDGIIQTLSVVAATPNDEEPRAADELQEAGIGQLTFSVNLKEMPDTVKWINELNAIPGFASARFNTANYLKSPDGDITYEFTGTVRLLEESYSLRFEPKAEDEVSEDANDS